MPNYNETSIYKLCCKDPTITDIYIGSTCNFTKRKYGHKSISQNPNNKRHNQKVYSYIRDNGGFDNWDMILLELVSVSNKREKEQKERIWIDKLKSSLNTYLPTQTITEYKIKNNESILIKKKEYYKNHKEDWVGINANRSSEKIICECGGSYTKQHKSTHFKSVKHSSFV